MYLVKLLTSSVHNAIIDHFDTIEKKKSTFEIKLN